MDELLEVSRKLTADDGSRYGFVNSASAWNLYGHVVAEGGELLIEEGDTPQVNLDGPIVKEVVKKYTELSTVHEVAPIPPAQQRQTDHPVAMFGTGRAASFVSGPFDLSRIENEFPDVYEDVGTAVIPGPEKGSTMGGGSLFVPKGSENKVAAFELMKWFISDKYAIRLAEEMGRHPVKTHLYENELYQDPLLQPFIETLQYAKPYKLEAYPEANDAWSQAIRDIFNGADVENTLDQAQKTAEQAIDKSSH
jgi:ABC-type glycerol-3-phosphate transport system substrate-binding protein